MSTTGLKHVSTEPSRLESKRERRRGASGRAAALRRAPSDSDCSGETASLSADSGDRSVRPAPPPQRSGKTRNRRRGSEWEILEGLKDGQRFDKRPEVFNGYLHKKRKWPLKGWHKRFFVVDGGILVYARSPTDVARGRLHGSVDVGLSVISAKARRRRIDIDADEFIYHLRAKTPDGFRTWLNVLKVHRLYRQHLLTFGARESVPKIHAPLEDHPPTDTSSHILSQINFSKTLQNIQNKWNLTHTLAYPLIAYTPKLNQIKIKSLKHMNIINTAIILNKSERNIEIDIKDDKDNSLNSINYIKKITKQTEMEDISSTSLVMTDFKKQIHSTNLDLNVKERFETSPLDKYFINSSNITKNISIHSVNIIQNNYSNKDSNNITKLRRPFEKLETTPTLYFFAKKKFDSLKFNSPNLKRSKKSTNLVKYKNIYEEPTLRRPISKSMLLGKYKSKRKRMFELNNIIHDIFKKDIDTQVKIEKEHKEAQNSFTTSEYDAIVEKLLISNNEKFNFGVKTPSLKSEGHIKSYISNILKKLYDIKVRDSNNYPVKKLFKYLLEYWLTNTLSENIKEIITQSKSISRPSNHHFNNDQTTSNINMSEATQFCGEINFLKETLAKIFAEKTGKLNKFTYRIIDSYEKERRIQELEKVLKNTVYIYAIIRSKNNRETDIKITKKLINNIGNLSHNLKKSDDSSDSSNELPKIQETINNLLSETDIPTYIAKEFLGAYLDLLHENEIIDLSTSTEDSKPDICRLKCEVDNEPVRKKVSVGIATKDFDNKSSKGQFIDSGQMYLKGVLDKITTIFSKEPEDNKNNLISKTRTRGWSGIRFNNRMRDELGNIENDNCQPTSVVIDVSKYDLEHLSMTNNPPYNRKTSITMKLKEKTPNFDERQPINLYLKFANDRPREENLENKSNSDILFDKIKPINPQKLASNPYVKVDTYIDNEDIKPYYSSSENFDKGKIINKNKHNHFDSDGTSKAHLQDFSPETEIDIDDRSLVDTESQDDAQTCFIMSFKKDMVIPKLHSKKFLKENIGNPTLTTCCTVSKNLLDEISAFENMPKLIDENFVILLLEKLTILSKNFPNLYKEINILYQKLRKKYDKSNNKVQGLSLLGKIYNDESKIKYTLDNETEIEQLINSEFKTSTCIHISNFCIQKNKSNKSISVDIEEKLKCHKEVQALESRINISREYFDKEERNILNLANTDSTQTAFSPLSTNEDIKTMDRAISNQNWYRLICTKDCALSTLTKYIMNSNENIQNFRLNPINHPFDCKRFNNTKLDPKIRQHLIKEMDLLSSSFRISTQSQTEKKLRCLKEKSKDYNIYQIYLSQKYKIKKSVSAVNVQEINDDLKTIYRCTSESCCSGLLSPSSPIRGPQAGFVSGTPGGRFAGWIIESGGPLDTVSRELGQAQLSVQQLQRLLDALELQQQAHHDTDVSLEGASPNVKKDRRKFGLRKKKSNSKCASVELQPPHIDPSNSHMALSALTAPPSPGGGAASIPASAASLPIACAATRPQSLPGAEVLNAPTSLSSLTPDQQLREDFTVLAKDLVANLKGVVTTLVRERGRIRAGSGEGAPLLASLRTDLTTALQQNSELRSRLSRIHDASDLAEISSMAHDSDAVIQNRQFPHSLSYSSSCVSASEFFDAEEHDDDLKPNEMLNADEAGVIELDGDSSSEAGSLSSEEGSASSDNSDAAMVTAEQATLRAHTGWARRTRLPATRPSPGGPSLWNLLYKNIGKDLSQVSMPVTINEPLNMLQRLCEELEYSELLDAAAQCPTGIERCALIAAFAVSAYAAAAQRAASKPFNPLLCETYECVRADRGFRFIAEQVSHHPPISACHAESPRWVFWQEARIKTKFWGKSMEFQPAGRVHVTLLTTGDRYSWNKVTTCVHNLFGGQRWVDQYGDMHITCHGTDISCKLNFIKASSWSSSRHEVRGAVTEANTGTRLRLAGRWSEALYAGDPPAARCLWRPGAMPPEHELYYGFTRFAMELNELEPGMRDVLPHTDTRLRPDQRALEEGDVDSAEQYKHQLEQAQRERRRDSPEHTPAWFRKSAETGEETWTFTGSYWKARDAGFPDLSSPRLW